MVDIENQRNFERAQLPEAGLELVSKTMPIREDAISAEIGDSSNGKNCSFFGRMILLIWAVSLPINTFVIIPSNQGSQIPNIMGLASIFFVLSASYFFSPRNLANYWRDWATLTAIWLLFLGASQLAHIFNNEASLNGLRLIRFDAPVVLAPQLFTQSIYLLSSFSIFTFYRHLFPREYLHYIFYGAWLMAVYGMYEWAYFYIFGKSGDFLGNRVFSNGYDGSWTQSMDVGGLNVMRIKSTFGEPSFYTAASVPFLFLSFMTKRYWLGSLLILNVVLSWSTTAFIGIFGAILLMAIAVPKTRVRAVVLLALAGSGFWLFTVTLPDTYDEMFNKKLSGQNNSGKIRYDEAYTSERVEERLSEMQKWVGVGFGYVYASVWGAIKTNMGYLGAALFVWFFLWPYVTVLLRGTDALWPLAAAIIFLLYYINVAEFFLPTTWTVLALAWRSLDEKKAAKTSNY